jgi:hypothetical protein
MIEPDRQSMFTETAAALPVGRVGNVDDLAQAALAILENGFVNGTVMHVDDGTRIA